MIALIGFMGAGKTSVGREVARRIGAPFLDTDELIEARSGYSIAEYFTRAGEPAFRAVERDVVDEALAKEGAVVSLGGGSLGDPSTVARLQWGRVVYLQTSYGEAMRRVGHDPGRPLLQTRDPLALFEERRALYERVATVVVDTDGRTVAEVADEVQRSLGQPPSSSLEVRRVGVATDPGYQVVVGAGLIEDAATFLPKLDDAERAALVTHSSLDTLAKPLAASLEADGLAIRVVEVPEGEASKSLAGAARLYDEFAAHGLHRHDLVVAVGGGVVTDLAGYAASTYNRGVAIAHVPTTLLGQVDAAVGGKTGVNTDHGKNLIGTFHQPVAVLCDVQALASLPTEELRAGLAEVVKYGFISDPGLLELLRARPAQIYARDGDVLTEIVTRSVEIKAGIVAADEFERGTRAWLNYGHTFAHAIENVSGYGAIRHGEAVSLGMMAAAYLARELGRIDDELVDEHRRTLDLLGLPTKAVLDFESLERAWIHDKKHRRGTRFVLLAGRGRPEAGIAAPPEAVRRAVERLSR